MTDLKDLKPGDRVSLVDKDGKVDVDLLNTCWSCGESKTKMSAICKNDGTLFGVYCNACADRLFNNKTN